MKRAFLTILTVAAFAALIRLPSPATDIGKLEPVAAVRITATEKEIVVETDTGACGSGVDLSAAVADLQNRAGAYVFLDTADYLLLSGLSDGQTAQLLQIFRPAAYVCVTENICDLSEAAKYLAVHPPEKNLNDLRAG